MMTNETDVLLRYLEGRTTAVETEAVQGRLVDEPAFAERLRRLERLRGSVQAARPDSFGPYFSDRVARRVRGHRPVTEAMVTSMGSLFARLAVAGLLIAASLGAYNVVEYQRLGLEVSVIEAMFGLPGTSVIDAVAFDLDAFHTEI
jgi:anti-sigma factor RsiW